MPALVESAVRVEPEMLQYNNPFTTSYVVDPGEPAEGVVLRFVVVPNAIEYDPATTVNVLCVLPAVKETMLP